MERLFGTHDFSKVDYIALVAQSPGAAEPACLISICKRDKSRAFAEHLGLRCLVFQTAVFSKAWPVPSKPSILRWLIHDFCAFHKQPRRMTCGWLQATWLNGLRESCYWVTLSDFSPHFSSLLLSHCSLPLFLKSIKAYFWFATEREWIVLGSHRTWGVFNVRHRTFLHR